MLKPLDRRTKLSVLLLVLGLLFLVLSIAYDVSFIGFALIFIGAAGVRDTRWQVAIIFACIGLVAVWGGYQVGKHRALADSHGSVGRIFAPANAASR